MSLTNRFHLQQHCYSHCSFPLYVYQTIYVSILTYGHMLRVVTERLRMQLQVVEIMLF